MQNSVPDYNWDNCYYTQVFSILDKLNLVELVKLNVAIGCKKNVCVNCFQLRLEKI